MTTLHDANRSKNKTAVERTSPLSIMSSHISAFSRFIKIMKICIKFIRNSSRLSITIVQNSLHLDVSVNTNNSNVVKKMSIEGKDLIN